jgi:hypothetical protein
MGQPEWVDPSEDGDDDDSEDGDDDDRYFDWVTLPFWQHFYTHLAELMLGELKELIEHVEAVGDLDGFSPVYVVRLSDDVLAYTASNQWKLDADALDLFVEGDDLDDV